MDEYFIASLVSNIVWEPINDISDEEIAIKTIMFFVVRLIIYNFKKLKIDLEVLIVINFYHTLLNF